MNKPSKTQRSRKTQNRKNTNASQYNNVLDRSKPLNDGTVGAPQDRFERAASMRVPNSVPRDFSRQGYWYKASYLVASFSSNTVPVSVAYSFAISNLDAVTSLCTVFDQYAIVEVVLRVTPNFNNQTTTASIPDLLSVIDHDDAGTLLSVAAAQSYSTCLETTGFVGHTRVIQPRVAIAAYSGTLFNAFANQRTYIDAGSPAVPHYGVKFVTSAATVSITYTITAELFVHFRDIR